MKTACCLAAPILFTKINGPQRAGDRSWLAPSIQRCAQQVQLLAHWASLLIKTIKSLHHVIRNCLWPPARSTRNSPVGWISFYQSAAQPMKRPSSRLKLLVSKTALSTETSRHFTLAFLAIHHATFMANGKTGTTSAQ